MKVNITKSSSPSYWYAIKNYLNITIGSICDVKEFDESSYELICDPKFLIDKGDCEIVEGFAKEEVTSFAEWISLEKLVYCADGTWIENRTGSYTIIAKNTDVLLELFLTTIKTA